jgi:ABC-2 type transport system ATP-binding protein
MLDLVRRTGTEFGIAVIVSSHLLGEIERVCDSIVAIEGGTLLRADTLSSFTGRTRVLLVEVDEGMELLASALERHGLRVGREGRILLVDAPDDGPHDLIRDAVVDLDLSLVRLEQRRGSLEDLFRPDALEVARGR